MPIDPNVEATTLIAQQELTPVQRQNRYGAKHQSIQDIPSGKFLTVLAIQTTEAFTPEQFFEILNYLQAGYGVEAIQTVFGAVVPDFGDGIRNDLHLTAHLRAEEIPPAVPSAE